ncbi:MAG: GFA family protein [Janthinobacterium lividum]
MQARCVCGGVTVDLPGFSSEVIACHCLQCQQRTGSPFGVGAYYPAESVSAAGNVTEFVRPTARGGTFRTFFCPICGTSVYWITSAMPGMIGVAAGAIAEPDGPSPKRSVWEESMHRWVLEGAAMDHYPRGWCP